MMRSSATALFTPPIPIWKDLRNHPVLLHFQLAVIGIEDDFRDAVVGIRVIVGHQLVGDAHRRRNRSELHAKEVNAGVAAVPVEQGGALGLGPC